MKINGEYIDSTLLKGARSISGFRNFERKRKKKEIKKKFNRAILESSGSLFELGR